MKLTEEQKEIIEWMLKENFVIGIPHPQMGGFLNTTKIEEIEEYFSDIVEWKAKSIGLTKEQFIEIERDLENLSEAHWPQCFATTNKGERCKRSDGRWTNLILENPEKYLEMKHNKEFLCPIHREKIND